jgi:hypothetical protein
MDNYKVLIDSTELQQKILDYIASEEFCKMVDSTVFKDNNQCKMAIIHGMSIASILTCRCEQFYINFKKEKYEDDNRPQCCIDHDKYFSTCDTCEFGGD